MIKVPWINIWSATLDIELELDEVREHISPNREIEIFADYQNFFKLFLLGGASVVKFLKKPISKDNVSEVNLEFKLNY